MLSIVTRYITDCLWEDIYSFQALNMYFFYPRLAIIIYGLCCTVLSNINKMLCICFLLQNPALWIVPLWENITLPSNIEMTISCIHPIMMELSSVVPEEQGLTGNWACVRDVLMVWCTCPLAFEGFYSTGCDKDGLAGQTYKW